MKAKSNKELEYGEMVKKESPNSPIAMNCLKAFISGGIICAGGELLKIFYGSYGLNMDDTSLAVSLTLIFISVTLTGLGLYGKLGKFCGAGTIVPITGFANSVASPAIEFKKEGFVIGLGSKMFAVAGPVIVYGTVTSFIVGIIYYFVGR